MLRWALIFFVLALVAGLFGFGGIAAGAAEVAKILFYAFVVIFAISLMGGLLKGKKPWGCVRRRTVARRRRWRGSETVASSPTRRRCPSTACASPRAD